MVSPVYCIVSGGAVHCVPVTTFNNANTEKLKRHPLISTPLYNLSPKDASSIPVNIHNRNLLYTLNNPSLSDLESENNINGSERRASTASTVESAHEETYEPLQPSLLPPTQFSTVPLANRSDDDLDGPDSAHINGNVIQIKLENSQEDDDDDETEVNNLTSIIGDYSTHAVYLPQYSVDIKNNLDSDYSQIKSLLRKMFASWSPSDEIQVTQLTGGITNMLLACLHVPSNETFLMRVYGQGTNLIIDRHREFVSHLVLNSLHLAPPVHARFANGLIYGFLPGRSLKPHDLSNPALYPLIAQQLGNWHNSINAEYIENGIDKLRKYTAGIKKQFLLSGSPEVEAELNPKLKRSKKMKRDISSIWQLIEDWILVVPANDALANIFNNNLPDVVVNKDNVREVVLREFEWLKTTLNRTTKSSVVVCHCDLLSGNIVVPDTPEFQENCRKRELLRSSLPENPVRFIDYEYMLPAPRAFDIANHFAEWQGFDCDRSAIPEPSSKNEVMLEWCRSYLNGDASHEETQKLIDEIACYYGLPGFYWGIWAMIQSELSTIDFNYAEYSGFRLEEYWQWKDRFLLSKK